MQELKHELGSLVSKTVEKAFGDAADKPLQDRLVDQALRKTGNR
jgi:F0F1-type ATP synthase membrane subunit b/b'